MWAEIAFAIWRDKSRYDESRHLAAIALHSLPCRLRLDIVKSTLRNLSVTRRWFTTRVTISAVIGGARPCVLKMNHPGNRGENRRFVVGARHSKKNA